HRLQLGPLGNLAREVFVDVARPDLEPTLKELALQRHARMQREVHLQRIASIAAGAKEHSVPEISEYRQVTRKIELRDIGEDGPDQRVGERPPVERVDQPR